MLNWYFDVTIILRQTMLKRQLFWDGWSSFFLGVKYLLVRSGIMTSNMKLPLTPQI